LGEHQGQAGEYPWRSCTGMGDPIHFVPGARVVAADLALRSSPRPSAAFLSE